MSERKSVRSRKSVNYASFDNGDDLDDDFADSTPPVSKKARLSNKENKEKKSNTKVQEVKKETKTQHASNRKSLDDRRYERELQEALQLSMSQSDPSQESTGCHDNPSQNEAPVLVIEHDDRNVPSPILPAIENPPVLQKVTKEDDDVIEVLETSIDAVPSSRKAANKRKKCIESDSDSGKEDFEIDLRKFLSSPLTPKIRKAKDEDTDFAPDDDDSDDDDISDDDEYNPEDSDSDFGTSKKKKSAKKSAVKTKFPKKGTNNTKSTKTSSAKSTTGQSKQASKTSSSVRGELPHRPLAASSPSPRPQITHKPPNWKPPGAASENRSPAVLNSKTKNIIVKSPAGLNTKSRPPLSGGVVQSPLGGVNIKSPSSGLRLGLSRNMKLKPLHPNVKTKN